MAPHFNAASRVHALFEKAVPTQDHISVLNTWKKVFNISIGEAYKERTAVATTLGMVAEQLDNVFLQMSLTNYSQDIYQFVINRLHEALSYNALDDSWGGQKSKLDPPTLNSLRWLSETIPSEGLRINTEDLDLLREQLIALRNDVLEGTSSEEAKRFLLQQIEVLLKAIREYDIVGNVVFTAAYNTTRTDVTLKRALFEASSDDEGFRNAWERFTQCWIWIKDRSEDIQVLLTLYDAAQLANTAAHHFKLLPG